MRKELAALSKDTLIYGMSTVISRFLNFLLVPFYVNVLHSTAEYGIASSLYAWIAFLTVIYPLGLEGAFFRYASHGDHDDIIDEEERKNFSSPFNVTLLFGLILSLALFFLASSIAPPLFRDPIVDIASMLPMLEDIVRYSAVILFFDSISVIPFAALREARKAKTFAALKITNVIVTLALNFILILGFDFGVRGIFLANMAASVLTFMLLVPTFIRKWKRTLDTAVLRKMLPFGVTNVPANLGAMMVQVIDRPIVQMYLGLGAVGIYQANYRMGFIMMVVVSLFEYAWRPFFMRQHKTDDVKARLLFAKIFTYFLAFTLVLFLLLSFFLPFILSTPVFGRQLLRSDYLVGMSIIPVILFAYIFQGMYTNFIAGIYIKEQNKVLPLITGAGAFVNVITNLLLIPPMGIMGAALATLAAYIVMAVLIYRESQKVYPIAYEWGRIRKLFAIVACAFIGEFFITAGGIIESQTTGLYIRITISLGVAAAIYFSGFFLPEELRALKHIIRKGNRQSAG